MIYYLNSLLNSQYYLLQESKGARGYLCWKSDTKPEFAQKTIESRFHRIGTRKEFVVFANKLWDVIENFIKVCRKWGATNISYATWIQFTEDNQVPRTCHISRPHIWYHRVSCTKLINLTTLLNYSKEMLFLPIGLSRWAIEFGKNRAIETRWLAHLENFQMNSSLQSKQRILEHPEEHQRTWHSPDPVRWITKTWLSNLPFQLVIECRPQQFWAAGKRNI